MGLGWREPDATSRGESPERRKAGATLADTQRNGRLRKAGGRRRRAHSPSPGGPKPPVLGPRASDAGKCPHPGNLQRSAAAATPSGRQNGGGGGGSLVLRGEPGPRDPRDGPRWPAAVPRRLCPPCPTGYTWSPRDGLRPPRRPPSGPWPLSRSPSLPGR